MKIIVEIPQEMWERVKIGYVSLGISKYLKNGTPLPQGHGRLIEVSKELECELWTYTRYTGIDEAPYEDATNALELAPTIIEADVLKEGEAK